MVSLEAGGEQVQYQNSYEKCSSGQDKRPAEADQHKVLAVVQVPSFEDWEAFEDHYMESECGWPQNSSPDRALTTEAYDLQSQINTALATADLQLLQYSNSLATLRREEEKTLLERVVKLQRHHKAVRDKLGNGENAAKAIALLLKAFRVAKDIAKAEYRMLVQAEIALGPISSRPLSHFPARQERTVKLMREKPPAVSQSMRFSRSAVYMRKKRLEVIGC